MRKAAATNTTTTERSSAARPSMPRRADHAGEASALGARPSAVVAASDVG
jgi:hypothetical protein